MRPSFVPPKEIRELLGTSPATERDRYKSAPKRSSASKKVLQEAGIKLSSVATRVLGASGRAMIEALVNGTTDPEVLAELAKGRLRKKIPALKEALEGNFFSAHHAFMLTNILAHIDYLEESIARLSTEIERVNFDPFCEEVALLETNPGVDRRTAETLIAEIGVDMSRFATSRHLASWA